MHIQNMHSSHHTGKMKKVKHIVSYYSNSKFSGTLKKMETIDSISDNPMMDEKIYL